MRKPWNHIVTLSLNDLENKLLQLHLARGSRRLLRSLTSKNSANEADMEVHDFRSKLTACKCPMLKQNNPDAARMCEIGRKDGEKEQRREIGKKSKSFAHHTS